MWSVVVPETLQTIGREIGAFWPIMVALAAVAAFIRWVYSQYRNDFKELKEEVTEAHKRDYNVLKKELTPNAGTSMKDALGRIEVNIDEIKALANNALDIGSENATRLEAIISNSRLAYFEMDTGRNIIKVNREYLDLFRLTEIEAISSTAWELIHPRDKERVFAAAEHAFENQHPLITIAHFRPKDTARYLKMEIRSFPKFIQGEFRGFVGTIAVIPEGIPVVERLSNVERLLQHHIDYEEERHISENVRDHLPENHEDYDPFGSLSD